MDTVAQRGHIRGFLVPCVVSYALLHTPSACTAVYYINAASGVCWPSSSKKRHLEPWHTQQALLHKGDVKTES